MDNKSHRRETADTLRGATHLIVVDLEATCSDDGSVPRDQMETIEIGAVLVDVDGLAAADTFQCFVEPVRHPILTRFCTELTGITQDMVAGAPPFAEAVKSFKGWMDLGERHAVFGSWGDYDRKQLTQDSRFHGLAYPMPRHVNLKQMFSDRQDLRKRQGMAGALRLCGLPLEGDHHRALDDARNIAKLLPWILGDARI
ncbi:MAG: exonuclease domain-containing protein [Hyphomicrobiales bacterium]